MKQSEKERGFFRFIGYEVNNTLLAEHTSLNAAQMQQLLEGYGLLVLFAAALVGAGMVISKMREKEA